MPRIEIHPGLSADVDVRDALRLAGLEVSSEFDPRRLRAGEIDLALAPVRSLASIGVDGTWNAPVMAVADNDAEAREAWNCGVLGVMARGTPAATHAAQLLRLLELGARVKQASEVSIAEPESSHHDGTLLDSKRFQARVAAAIEEAARSKRYVAVIALDIRRVRSLTTSNISSDAGTRVVEAIVDRLRVGLRGSDALGEIQRERHPDGMTIACVNGNELVVLIDSLPAPDVAARIGTRFVQLLSTPFNVNGCELCIPTIIGIALYPEDGREANELIERAETAAYCARQDGNGVFRFYSPELDARAFERLTLESSLRRGLERDEFLVYYQPKVEIRSGRLVGFEALVRWKHPELGFISPGQFIGLAEETGLVVPLGEWVMREACRQNRAWQSAGLPPVRVAVNLSSVQFRQTQLSATVADVLSDTGLDANWLELEITEGTLMDHSRSAIDTLRKLKHSGVHLSIDDFGTGYSSLAYLKRFPIDSLKVDQSFIREVTRNSDDAAIVTSILLMARSLKLGTVAEGVETQAQLDFLRVLLCDEVQGYLYSPPVPAPLAEAFLRKGISLPAAA